MTFVHARWRRCRRACTTPRVDLAPRSVACACLLAAALPLAPARADTGRRGGEPEGRAAARAHDARGAERALAHAARLRAGHGVRTGRELTPALAELAARLPALRGAERRRGEALLARPGDGAADPFQDGYTVPEATPFDTAHFRIHYVAAGVDAPPLADADQNGVPDYVETMGAQFETSYEVENVQLGWRAPIPDGTRGGDARTDVYIKQIGNQGLFGYAAADPGQPGAQRFAFLVMDNDYAQSEFPSYAGPLAPMQVTAAHEYNHVLHNAIDANEDFWLFESTAVWMEDQVFDAVNDYANYLPAPRWVTQTRVPLTRFNAGDPADPTNVKVYGDVVWSSWLSSRFGPDVMRAAWDGSPAAGSFAPGAEDAAIRARGGGGFSLEFVLFAAAVAEWSAPGAAFAESAEIPFPDVERLGGLAPAGGAVETALDHTTFSLYDVPPSAGPRITLSASLRPGVSGGLALVGRPADGSPVAFRVLGLPLGGSGRVALDGAGAFARITAVLVNADISQSGFSSATGDWAWNADGACATASLAADGSAPVARLVSRAKGAPIGATIVVAFSEPVHCAAAGGVELRDPSGRPVPATIRYDAGSGRLSVDPAGNLTDSARYRLALPGVVDDAGNRVAGGGVTIATVRRKPIFLLSGPSSQRARDVARRGLRVTLRSSDRDRVRYAVRVEGSARAIGARTIGRRSGRLAPRATVRIRVRLSRATRRALASGRAVRLTVRAAVTDPQRNTARRTRTVVVRP